MGAAPLRAATAGVPQENGRLIFRFKKLHDDVRKYVVAAL